MSHPHEGHGHTGQAHPASAPSHPTVKDPVCGMDVTPGQARGGSAEHADTTYWFCSPSCRDPQPDDGRRGGLIGSFSLGAKIDTKGGLRIDVSNSVQDSFLKNQSVIRVELRCFLAITRPPTFAKITGLPTGA